MSPLVGPLCLFFIVVIAGEDLRGPPFIYDISELFELFGIAGLFLVFGAPLAYVITLLIGIPVYLVATKLSHVNFWPITIGAAFIAIFPVLVATISEGFSLYGDPNKSSIPVYLSLAISGYLVGVVFWFISGLYSQAAHNKRMQTDRQTATRFVDR